MKNELVELENSRKMCEELMKSPHYAKIGPAGIYAIVEKAKSIGVSTMDALNGGMFFVQGKVELTAAMMNQLIRQAKHSITKDKKSDDTICILHGKRADNGDTWVESFSIADAKLAGIYRNQWLKYPKDMLFARALSRLARQLFPDILKGAYIQGEIEVVSTEPVQELSINEYSYNKMMKVVSPYPELIEELKKLCKVDDLIEITDSQLEACSMKAKKYIQNLDEVNDEAV